MERIEASGVLKSRRNSCGERKSFGVEASRLMMNEPCIAGNPTCAHKDLVSVFLDLFI